MGKRPEWLNFIIVAFGLSFLFGVKGEIGEEEEKELQSTQPADNSIQSQ